MMRTLKQRVLVTLSATILVAALGVLVGYFVGRSITIRMAQNRLMQHATEILVEEETYSAEARVLLSIVNHSLYPFCSDGEIAWFRKLIYQSEYLKEVGHMRDGKIECSAVLGRENAPDTQFKPDYSRWDGSKIYLDPAPLLNNTQSVTAVQIGDSFIVYNPYNTRKFDAPPMRYTIKLFDVPSREYGEFTGSSTTVDPSVPAKDGLYQFHNNLYAVRCSSRFSNCVTTFMTVPEALLGGRHLLGSVSLVGAAIGACLGFLCSFLYRRNRSMEQQLRRAITRDEVRVVYQPIVDMKSKRIVGAEALARWMDEDGSSVGPDVFVRLAEEFHFVGEITRLVIRQSLRDLGEMLRSRPDFRLNINVSAADLADPDFLGMLDEAVQQAKVSPQSLAIEITESSTANHASAIETIRQLRRKGYGVHIDDFGTGYSSLSYLSDLSVDAIKIDRSFTQAIGTEAVTVAILPQILAMADALHLHVIVEGIETDVQANYFAGTKRTFQAQGWLYGRPVAADEFQIQLASDDRVAPETSDAECILLRVS